MRWRPWAWSSGPGWTVPGGRKVGALIVEKAKATGIETIVFDRNGYLYIAFFRDPFRLVPINQISEIADKFTRNEILSSNEVRQIVGMKPSNDPKADELRNKNLSAPNEQNDNSTEEENQNEGI